MNGERNLVACFAGLGINDNEAENDIVVFSNTDKTITIVGAKEESQVTVYNLQGQMIYKGTEKTIKVATVGLYIVAVESKRTKVIVE